MTIEEYNKAHPIMEEIEYIDSLINDKSYSPYTSVFGLKSKEIRSKIEEALLECESEIFIILITRKKELQNTISNIGK